MLTVHSHMCNLLTDKRRLMHMLACNTRDRASAGVVTLIVDVLLLANARILSPKQDLDCILRQ